MSAAVEMFREECIVNGAKRDAGLTTPEDIKRFNDIQYGPNAKWNVLDVYRPRKRKDKLPVIVNVHGGGWVYGDKEVYQFYGMSLAEKGFAVINFTYRLAPEYKYPAQMEDINMVMEWAYRCGEQYGFDLEHIFLVGDSAGAHLAGIYNCICANADYASRYSFKIPDGFVPNALALNCGTYTPLPTKDGSVSESGQSGELVKALMPEGGTYEEAEFIDLTRHITSAFPPVFLMTAIEDFCKPQAACLEKALKEQKITYVYKLYGTEEEPRGHDFHLDIRDRIGQKCNDDECLFFRNYCEE